ncbi:hypothetical protein Hanom_Chr06g00555291 [Helianthus anomalus]
MDELQIIWSDASAASLPSRIAKSKIIWFVSVSPTQTHKKFAGSMRGMVVFYFWLILASKTLSV